MLVNWSLRIKILFRSATLAVLVSCEKDSEKSSQSITEKQAEVVAAPVKTTFQNATLRDSVSEEMLEENLFGKFFNGRAEFFIVKNPKMKV